MRVYLFFLYTFGHVWNFYERKSKWKDVFKAAAPESFPTALNWQRWVLWLRCILRETYSVRQNLLCLDPVKEYVHWMAHVYVCACTWMCVLWNGCVCVCRYINACILQGVCGRRACEYIFYEMTVLSVYDRSGKVWGLRTEVTKLKSLCPLWQVCPIFSWQLSCLVITSAFEFSSRWILNPKYNVLFPQLSMFYYCENMICMFSISAV